MFSLADQIFSHDLRISCFISDNRNLCRAGKHINTHTAIEHAFGLSHKPVPRPYQNPSWFAPKQAKRHAGNRLNPA